MLQNALERNFQVALEIVLDICSMIISHEEMEKPGEYREMIKKLGETEILPEDFAERFQNAAGFRNVLVHQYTEIQVERLHEYLTDNLEDFDTFTKNIAEYARKQE
ncbi:MAG: DUF86 domain-containing protein [Candidatus Nanohaloarchaea archaeon]